MKIRIITHIAKKQNIKQLLQVEKTCHKIPHRLPRTHPFSMCNYKYICVKHINMILVTGATGLNGSAIIREFSRQNIPVKALVRDPTKVVALPAVEIVAGDMLQPATLQKAFQDVHRVLMISSAREQLMETQKTFIDAAKKAGIPHIVKFSGAESGIGFDANAFRGTRQHEEVERYLENSGLAWTHLRPSQFMQMYLREVRTIISLDSIILPMGNAALSPVDVEDIAKIAVALLTSDGHEGKSYDITGPEALTMTEVAEHISAVLGRTIKYVHADPEKYKQSIIAAGVPIDLVETLDELFAERRRRLTSKVNLNTHELFNVPPATFREFVLREKAAFEGRV